MCLPNRSSGSHDGAAPNAGAAQDDRWHARVRGVVPPQTPGACGRETDFSAHRAQESAVYSGAGSNRSGARGCRATIFTSAGGADEVGKNSYRAGADPLGFGRVSAEGPVVHELRAQGGSRTTGSYVVGDQWGMAGCSRPGCMAVDGEQGKGRLPSVGTSSLVPRERCSPSPAETRARSSGHNERGPFSGRKV